MEVFDVCYKDVDTTAQEQSMLEDVTKFMDELADNMRIAKDMEVEIDDTIFSFEEITSIRYFFARILESDFNIHIKEI